MADRSEEVGFEYKAHYNDFVGFIRGAVWKDILNELTLWMTNIYDKLSVENDPQEIYRFQGRLQALKEVVQLPDRIITEYELYTEREIRNAT